MPFAFVDCTVSLLHHSRPVHLIINPGALVGSALVSHIGTPTMLLAILPVAVEVATIWFLAEAEALCTLRAKLTNKDRARLQSNRGETFLCLHDELADLVTQTLHNENLTLWSETLRVEILVLLRLVLAGGLSELCKLARLFLNWTLQLGQVRV